MDRPRSPLGVHAGLATLVGGEQDGVQRRRIQLQLYGTEPLYIFDPKDASNRPVPGIHDNPLAFHGLYPEAIRRRILQSFIDRLRSPNQRERESEWCKELIQVRDRLVYCSGCASRCFHDPESPRAPGALTCW